MQKFHENDAAHHRKQRPLLVFTLAPLPSSVKPNHFPFSESEMDMYFFISQYKLRFMQHTTSVPRIAGFISLVIGIVTVAFAFISEATEAKILLGAASIVAALVSIVFARKTTEDLQMSVAGLFFSLVACLIGLWQYYNL
ncbi:hypothetical protein MKQ68_22080 [Chitinophaga horti]|uniref:Uncharacterized protein n=1 Tax=Chitinophaga horti TaxID=2920382 RepID=A0ABY6IZF6_9BACT|nr:hypothetical protein [Chitinophaga horti]UYQ92772.1 hypothetical protein MKQ68_22080 [Chitinophaga horti]